MKWQEKGSRATSDLLGARLYREQANSRGKIVNINSLEAVFKKNGSLGQIQVFSERPALLRPREKTECLKGQGEKVINLVRV